MICKNCGNQMEDNAAFCTNCGTPASEAAPNAQAAPAAEAAPNAQAAPVTAQPTTVAPVAPKSKTTAVLLAWFLGAFGVHNFYLGDATKAIIQLAITVVSCGTLAIVSAYWAIAEAIMLLTGKISTDAKGNPLDI